jgi:hypothetical protein
MLRLHSKFYNFGSTGIKVAVSLIRRDSGTHSYLSTINTLPPLSVPAIIRV